MTAEQDIATVREGIRYGEYDCRLLSGRDFDPTYWAGKDAALDRLAECLASDEMLLESCRQEITRIRADLKLAAAKMALAQTERDRLAERLDHAEKALRAIASEPPSHLRDGVDVRVLDALARFRGTP